MSPSHTVAAGHGWRLWRTAVLRGAGFAADEVLALAGPASARAADALLAAEDGFGAARAALLATAQASRQGHPAWSRVLKRLYARKLPATTGDQAIDDALAPVLAAAEGVASAAAALTEALELDGQRVQRHLRQRATTGPLREAMVWQNRAAVRRVDETFAAGARDDSAARKQDRLLAMYLQRYAVKNDTIGFFGPVGWAVFRDDGPPLAFSPGATLLDKRTVYFEHWAIDALAATLSEDAALLQALPPRRNPTVRLESDAVIHPIERRTPLPAPYLAALRLCDGERPARAIAETLLADAALGLEHEDEVYELLDQLANKRLITWTLEIATQGPFPERRLRRALQAAGAAGLRGLVVLDALEAARAAVAAAAGDADALDRALAALEQVFTDATGQTAQRRKGESYAGRSPVYEDCRRNARVALGPDFAARLGEPLSLLLHSARWASSTIAAGYRRALDEAYQRLAAETGSETVDFLRYREAVLPLFPSANTGEPPTIVRQTGEALRDRWDRLLAIDPAARRIDRSAHALRAAVEAAFPADGPGWPEARFQQPDVMIAASSAAAFAAGDYQIVLGELHHSMASVLFTTYTKEHPEPGALFAARKADLPGPSVAPVEPKEVAVARSDYSPFGEGDLHVELGATRSWLPRAQVVAAADLVVDAAGVRTRDGAHRFDRIAFFEQQLIAAVNLIGFTIAPAAPHTPRVVIDHLVVQRERWRTTAAELAFAGLATAAERFAGCRRWARALGLPRLFFAKVPEEPKPTYVDLDSPLYVELFTRMVKKASLVTLTEMLPALEQCWLTDAEGRRYTAELRMVAVDPVAWPAR